MRHPSAAELLWHQRNRRGSWTPAQIGSDLTWWGGRGVGITTGATFTLADRSGNGRDFTQSTAANQPGTATVNGTACVDFPGVDDFLQNAGALSDFITTHSSVTYHCMFRFVVDAINTSAAFNGTAANDQLITNVPGYFGIAFADLGAGSYAVDLWHFSTVYHGVRLSGVVPGQSHLVDFKCAGGVITGRLDDGAESTNGSVADIPVAGRGGGMYMGQSFNGLQRMDGKHVEGFIVRRALTAAEHANARTYMGVTP